jgi:ESCRT-I complex subunit TSG101
LSALFEALQDQFSREPPVYSKPKQQPLTAYSSHNGNSYAVTTPPPLPRAAPSSSSSSPPPPIPIRPADLPSNSSEFQTVCCNVVKIDIFAQLSEQFTARPLSPPPLPPPPHFNHSTPSTLNQQSWYVPPARPAASFPPVQTPTTQHRPNESRLSLSPPPPPPPLPPPHFAPPMRLPESNSAPTPARNPQPPIADLLDGDADVSREGNSIQSPMPPPRPLNPELLSLHTQVHAKLTSELDSLTQALALDAERLRAHQSDLLSGEPAIHDEMARLEAVRDVCRNVAYRTNGVVQQVEANISELRRKGDPEVDELICSTSIVHNQYVEIMSCDKLNNCFPDSLTSSPTIIRSKTPSTIYIGL